MEFSFLLMRHAYSKHNQEKDEWKLKYTDKSYKLLPQYHRSKYSKTLLDSSLVDPQHCKNLKHKTIDLQNIALVLCSPLKRCLETCKYLLQGSQGVKVVVEPMLACRLSAAWSIGSSASQLVKQYPLFDFSAFEKCKQTWMFQNLSFLNRETPSEEEFEEQNTQQYILGHLKQGKCESYQQFFDRTQTLKSRLSSLLATHIQPSQSRRDILIISHSCVLSFLLGSELNEKGKVREKISFKHCSPRKYEGGHILGKWQKMGKL